VGAGSLSLRAFVRLLKEGWSAERTTSPRSRVSWSLPPPLRSGAFIRGLSNEFEIVVTEEG